MSAGGIYTHFENKHAIAKAIGSDATEPGHDSSDLAALGRRLLSREGETDARLDLQLWAESLHDPVLHEMVMAAMDRFRSTVAEPDPNPGGDVGAGIVEALVLGTEVQRALGRPIDPAALADTIEMLAAVDHADR